MCIYIEREKGDSRCYNKLNHGSVLLNGGETKTLHIDVETRNFSTIHIPTRIMTIFTC